MGKCNATIYEQGNGFPSVGDYCASNGTLYEITAIDGNIQTGDVRGNAVRATVAEADWSDCDEGDEHSALVVIDSESEWEA